jgi:hypothetical protein
VRNCGVDLVVVFIGQLVTAQVDRCCRKVPAPIHGENQIHFGYFAIVFQIHKPSVGGLISPAAIEHNFLLKRHLRHIAHGKEICFG